MVHLTFIVTEKSHFNKKSLQKMLLSFYKLEAWMLVWKPKTRANDTFKYGMIVMKVLTGEWLYCIKLFRAITVEIKTL